MQLSDNFKAEAMPESSKSKDNANPYKIALLISLACVLQISESMIPNPVPGIRLGLANMVTLVALVTMGFRSALEIAVFRTVLSSLIIGTFMSPTFILSFSAAVVSTMFMGFLLRLSSLHERYRLSIIGISIVGALTHNMVQLYLAYLLLVKHSGIFVFLPWLCISALIMGWITGTVAGGVCRRLEEYQEERPSAERVRQEASGPQSYHYCAGSSFLHRLRPESKIAAMMFLSLFVLMVDDFRILTSLFLLLALIIACSKIPAGYLFSRVKRFTFLMLIAFLMPLFFNQGTQALLKISRFAITHEGLAIGSIFASRILFLILLSSLLVRTTSPDELAQGLAKVLIPLRYLGISETRMAKILSLSWTALPVTWNTVRNAIRNGNFSKAKNLRNLMPLLSSLVADLYMGTESDSNLWKSACSGQHLSPTGQNRTGIRDNHRESGLGTFGLD